MAQAILKATDIPLPPEELGVSEIRVIVGQTRTISVDDVMESSNPPYYQKSGYPIGSIEITGYGADPSNLLDENFNPNIATIYTGMGIAYFDTLGKYVENALSSNASIKNGQFKVIGAGIGRDYITYKATAINPNNNKESVYTTKEGVIWINVISAVNQPPSSVGDNTILFTIGTPIVFTEAMFTTGTTPPYSDPEGDPAYSLKVLTLPTTGILTLFGVPVQVGDVILFSDIRLGGFRYFDFGQAAPNQNIPFQYQVNDSGSLIFVG